MLPAPVVRLLHADSPDAEAIAWEGFVAEYSRLILAAVRTTARDPDDAMDSYAWVLERIRMDGAARLRHYAGDGRARFTTWLVVVARRLAVDRHRARYGRADGNTRQDARTTRRNLNDLLGDAIELEAIPSAHASADLDLRRSELQAALARALDGLDARDRLMLTLRFEEDMPASRIAKSMSFPTQFHVYRRLNHVLGSLREALRTRGFQESTP